MNVNTSSIEAFDIVVSYAEGFAALLKTSLGTISDVNQISINSSDLSNGSLESLESIEIVLIHDLLACDIEFVNYDLVIDCSLSACDVIQPFVDDNEVDQIRLYVIPLDPIEEFPSEAYRYVRPLFFDYGLCEPVYNSIVIKHAYLDDSSTLEEAYDISFSFDYDDFFNTYKQCIDPYSY
jgi:hypothetical protein